MSAPSVYAAINAITAELAKNGIAKTRTNEVDDYKYRSIDDVLDRLAPLLAKHRLCVLPRALERTVIERSDEQDRLLLHVALRVEFTLTSVEDGSSHVVEAFGEALDGGDKATAKAMSAAYKAAMVQTFCIPSCGSEDADRTSHRLTPRSHSPEPLQGWTQWCLDIEDIVALCESEHAIATGPGAQSRPAEGARQGATPALRRARAGVHQPAGSPPGGHGAQTRPGERSCQARTRGGEGGGGCLTSSPDDCPRNGVSVRRGPVPAIEPGFGGTAVLFPAASEPRSNARMCAPARTADWGSSRWISGRSASVLTTTVSSTRSVKLPSRPGTRSI